MKEHINMERSVHARNGKVWMPDRKLQIGNCFEEDKKYLSTSINLNF